MGLFQQACLTHDTMFPIVSYGDGHVPLAPIAHTVKSADLEIQLNTKGEFLSARLLTAEKVPGTNRLDWQAVLDAKTVIPVTERSLGRGSDKDVSPHYLCDLLYYFVPGNTVAYQSFIDQLSAWAGYARNDKLDAILAYVKSGTIVDDLQTVVDKKLNEKWLVRWIVDGAGPDGRCWTDTGLMRSLTEYHLSRLQSEGRATGVCMVEGRMAMLADSHAKGVVSNYGNAKLVSYNSTDNNRFTYKGRFLSGEQAVSIGYVASQKAHNALAWLVANQGVKNMIEGRVFLCWAPKGHEIPQVTGAMARRGKSVRPVVTVADYKKRIQDVLSGWKSEIPVDDEIVFTILDSPTPGCLSVLYYSEVPRDVYLNRLAEWDLHCCEGFSSPPLRSLIQYSYGIPRGGKYVIGNDAIYRQQMQRLILCRYEGRAFPVDIERRLVANASKLMLCSNKSGEHGLAPREYLLRAACSSVRKYRFDMKGEDWPMVLDVNCSDRSYLFGRLLAVADHVESRVLYKRKEERETAALRLQQAFSQCPHSTWRNIYEGLGPYLQQLPGGSRNYYLNLISEIYALLPDENLNRRLDDVYLLGYFAQRGELRKSKSGGSGDDDAEGDTGSDVNAEIV